MSLFHVPATLFEHGTKEQIEKYFVGITHGTGIRCQGFSGPGAGSDLASLRTSARLERDHYVINSQKVWSLGAMNSGYCLLLARTDQNDKRKHDGISYFIMDMKIKGL